DDQNLVVNLTDFESNRILNSPSLFTARVQLRARHIISSPDLEEFREGLRQPCAATDEVLFTLIDDEFPRGNLGTAYNSYCTDRNGNELRIGSMRKQAVIPDRGQVRASRNLLGMLLFFDMKGRDAHHVIVLQRQLDGFMEID